MAHRDVNIFGEDVEVFKPESWLEADESTLRKMENNFLPVSLPWKVNRKIITNATNFSNRLEKEPGLVLVAI